MWIALSLLMSLTGLATLLSVLAQILSGSRGRPLLIQFQDLASYLCLSTAGLGFFISGLALLFHGGHWWMAVPCALWTIGMIRLLQMYGSARYTPRTCECCGFSMVRMGRGERFLSKRQKIEEKLHSREYDLWVCTCGHRRMFAFNGPRALAFRKCAVCAVNAVYDVRQTVTADGAVYVDHHCVACDHSATFGA